MTNFWKNIEKPIISLAPMEDVTDTAFRELVMRISNPKHLDVLFTEFTSTDGLCHEVGRENVIKRFKISDSERRLLDQTNTKIVAQIWGTDPEKYYRSAKFVAEEMDFDGIDINMGCPVKKIIKNGACSALINTPELAKEIIQATMEGSNLPVSVKTRSGIKQHQTENWMRHLLETKPAAITLHGRTQKDMSEVPAEWEEVGKAARVRDEIHPHTLIFGNGDIQSLNEAHEKSRQYNLDGTMIARGIFGNPWIFNPGYQPSLDERLDTLLLHTQLFDDYWQNDRNFAVLRRFYKIYVQGFPGASKLRASLMQTQNSEEVKEVIEEFRKKVPFTAEA
ncbi:MAG: tRNA-dihydrouridine synthase [Bacteroidales bacterium]|nr:tRNA-dihydrouridine synthase [Bacteroidales bacterium]MCF8332573.1 tRNA-dihydrouridine synthase [Bacteroidales bacterium]